MTINIYTDASVMCDASPARIGLAAQIILPDQEVRAGWYVRRPRSPGLVQSAEVEAIIFALAFTRKTFRPAQGTRIEVNTDSRLTVEMLMREQTVFSTLLDRLTNVERMLKCDITYNWIRRGLNDVADELAREAVYTQRNFVYHNLEGVLHVSDQ